VVLKWRRRWPRCIGSSALEVVQRLSLPAGILSCSGQRVESGCKRCFRLTRSIAYISNRPRTLVPKHRPVDSSSRAKEWFHSLTFLSSPTLLATVWSILSDRSCLAVRGITREEADQWSDDLRQRLVRQSVQSRSLFRKTFSISHASWTTFGKNRRPGHKQSERVLCTAKIRAS
jgi:hypothetical protein